MTAEEYQHIQGTNDPSDITIANCYVYSQHDQPPPDVAATLIVAEEKDPAIDNPLLVCRYHNLTDYSQAFGNAFFQAVQGRKYGLDCGKNFVEVNRNGGSSGKTVNPYIDKLLHFLNEYPASTPRKTIGCKVIQDKLCYHFFYLSTKSSGNLSPKTWKYSPPNIGGSFKIPGSTFVHFPFLLQFGRYKAITALMLQKLHTTKGLFIARTAAQQEIAHLQHAWDLYESIPHEVSNDVKETAIALVYNDYNKHSVVAYNVGYHKDIFNGKMPSLENKAVISIPGDSRKGRGGSDGNYFHYALLDWGDKRY